MASAIAAHTRGGDRGALRRSHPIDERQEIEMKALVYPGPSQRGWDTVDDPTIVE
jgi:hypothetical protein